MNIRVFPGRSGGSVTVPPSKSLGHRAVLAAMLAEGESAIFRVPDSQDMDATLGAARLWGAQLHQQGDTLHIRGDPLGQGYTGQRVDCGASASTLRFLVPILALQPRRLVRLAGNSQLMDRPLEVYACLFQEQGLSFHLTTHGLTLQGGLRPGPYHLDGSVSSQFITGLLFALPLLTGDSYLHLQSPVVSWPYVEMTQAVLAQFGVESHWEGDICHIPGNQQYQPRSYSVEGDMSQAAFFAVLGAINHPVELCGLSGDSLQGDRAVMDILRRAGAWVRKTSKGYAVEADGLYAFEDDLTHHPDLGPILAVLAMFCQGTTVLTHAGRLKNKESDRLAALCTELTKLGGQLETDGDTLWIRGGQSVSAAEPLDSWGDHRMAMALAVAASRAQTPTIICHGEAVAKSYPGFWQDLHKAGIHWEAE